MSSGLFETLARGLPAPVKTLIKRARSGLRARRRLVSEGASQHGLVRALLDAGISPGDTVVVHSSLAKLGKVEGGPQVGCQALLDCVGQEGTVLMPAFCSAETAIERSASETPIDLRNEPSQTGSITEALRRNPAALRSSHPFSSIAAVGKNAGFLCAGHDLDQRICHADSPLARLLQLDGKILGLGVDLGPVSFYHVVEDTWNEFPFNTYAADVPVIRYFDSNGTMISRPVAYYDRTISKTRIDHPDGTWIRSFLTEHLRRRGILHEFRIGSADGWWMQCRDLYQELQSLARRGVTIYSTKEQVHAENRTTAVVRS